MAPALGIARRPMTCSPRWMYRSGRLVAVALCARALAGCAAPPRTDMFTTAPLHDIAVDDVTYHISDRPDLGRLAIAADDQLSSRIGLLRMDSAFRASTDASGRAGAPLLRAAQGYFADSDRICRVLRAQPLADARWELTYDCSRRNGPQPTTWLSAGRSQSFVPRSP